MAIAIEALVILVACCLVVLVAIFIQLRRIPANADANHVAAEKQRDATAAILIGVIRKVGASINQQLQYDAAERRKTIQQLRPHLPFKSDEAANDWTALRFHPSRSQTTEPISLDAEAIEARLPAPPRLPPDAPTPRSGYSLEDLFPDDGSDGAAE